MPRSMVSCQEVIVMLLEDILSDSHFRERVQGIALDARKRLGVDLPVHQLGVVVPDAVAASAELERAGIRPFLLLGGSARLWKERGGERTMTSRIGFGYRDGIEIELLEPGTGSDFYRRSLDAKGRPYIQHLGFLVRDVDEWAKKLEDGGCPIYVRGRLRTGPLRIEFAYMDTEQEAGLILEFICHRLFGIRIKPPVWFQQFLGFVEKKSGKRWIEV
ncbi:MAG: VOC family protein [Spirochaetes bacterium]|nr:VOC family protein [Spirochaetota bacterium]